MSRKNLNCIPKSRMVYLAVFVATLAGCMATSPKMGGSSGSVVTGGAAGSSGSNTNSALESCDKPLGTAALFEDRTLPWWSDYRRRFPDLGSTGPVIRTMIQQSNCFVIVERGAGMAAMNRERELAQSGQLRQGSNIGGGQMVTADFTVSPSIQFSAKNTGGLKGIAGGLFGRVGSIVGGGLSKNEAATTLLLVDNRSGIQVASSVGNAANYDVDVFGGFFAGIAGGAKGFSNTPEGKILTAAFADSYNQMVKALRVYNPQRVDGGLGTGGGLEIDGQTQATDGAKIVPAPQPRADVVVETVVQRQPNQSSVTTNSNFNATIDQYDEDAINDYYESLKHLSEFASAYAVALTDNYKGGEQDKMRSNLFAYMDLFTNRLEGTMIELEAWPLSARREGWRVLGSRIERYNKMFERNRGRILNSNVIAQEVKDTLASLTVLTKEDFIN